MLETIAEFVGAVVGALVVLVLGLLFAAWVVMLLLGIAHGADPRVPALGFWAVVPLVIAVGGSAGAARSANG